MRLHSPRGGYIHFRVESQGWKFLEFILKDTPRDLNNYLWCPIPDDSNHAVLCKIMWNGYPKHGDGSGYSRLELHDFQNPVR